MTKLRYAVLGLALVAFGAIAAAQPHEAEARPGPFHQCPYSC